MIHAYHESYLSSAQTSLANYFDYLVNDCGFDAEKAASYFVITGYAALFEDGNPGILAGMSGIELARKIVDKATAGQRILPERIINMYRTEEYWAGWALAYYQWYSAHSFSDIFKRISIDEIIRMYHPYHEMDINRFAEDMEQRYKTAISETKLKIFREHNNLSQSELAKKSGVSLRSIQMYEQKAKDIDKAQAQTIWKLAKALNVRIDDLLEYPMR